MAPVLEVFGNDSLFVEYFPGERLPVTAERFPELAGCFVPYYQAENIE